MTLLAKDLRMISPCISLAGGRRVLPLLAAAVFLALPARAQYDGHDPTWPFAAAAKKGSLPSMDARDLWNLGIVGAKGSDGDKPPPGPRGEGMRRVAEKGGGKDRVDDGPKRLRIECLFPDGPAQKAGLKVGDVIIAVNGATFEKGSMPLIAKALEKAEGAPGNGVINFTVEVTGGKSRVVTVTVPAVGHDLADLQKPASRLRVAELALNWLVKRQTEAGGYPETLSGMNGAVVQTSLAGLAWLSAGDMPGKGNRGAAFQKALDFVLKNVDAKDAADRLLPKDGANWNQDNWGWAHAAIFLGELYPRQPSEAVRKRLQDCADFLQKSQVASGGWGHGPGGKNALGYIELNILAGLALDGLGLAKQAGCKLDEAAIRHAAEYIEASSGGDGGVGYSTLPGQQGQGNIGRSAGAWLGYVNLGYANRPFQARLKSYVARHIDDVLGGHASLMQHILLSGVAAGAMGGDVGKKYWQSMADDLELARAPDGSFQPRPWHESISMSSNGDVDTGEVWTTACWAIVIGADPSLKPGPGLPAWCGRHATVKK